MADRAKFLDFMDMIDGGGRGQMGGEFKGGGIFSEIANMIATPYGSEDPERRRRLQERRRARGLLDMDAIGTKEEQAAAAARAAATPSVVKRSVPKVTSSPRPQLRPAPVGKTMDQAVGGAQYPSMYRSMDSVVGGMGLPAAPAGRTMDQAVGGAQYPSMYRSMDSVVGSMGAPFDPAASIPAGIVPSTAGSTPNISSKYDPMVMPSTRNPSAYRPVNLSFPEFAPRMGAQPVSQSAPAPAQPTSVSDLPYADQVVAARQAIMREQITPDMLESVFGADFAREVMSGIQKIGGRTAVPNVPLGPLSIQRLHQTMPITRFD